GRVEGVHRAIGARRGLVGEAEQRVRGRAHRRRALADAAEQALGDRTETGDRAVDGLAAQFLLAARRALFLGATPLGDVFVRRHPAAAGQRLVLGQHDAAVARLHVDRRARALAHAVEDRLAVRVDVVDEESRFLAVLDQPAKRAA